MSRISGLRIRSQTSEQKLRLHFVSWKRYVEIDIALKRRGRLKVPSLNRISQRHANELEQ